MRAHKIEIHNPSTTADGGFGVFRDLSASVRDGAAGKAAIQACATKRPTRNHATAPTGVATA
jgi:hypothetical protein